MNRMKTGFWGVVLLLTSACGPTVGERVTHTPPLNTASSVTISVVVNELRSDEGTVGISLFDTDEGFPGAFENAVENALVEIVEGRAEYTFEDLEPGTYAVSVLHDENENGELDFNVFGMPSEGYGASRNPDARFSAPSFEESSFEAKGDVELEIVPLY